MCGWLQTDEGSPAAAPKLDTHVTCRGRDSGSLTGPQFVDQTTGDYDPLQPVEVE